MNDCLDRLDACMDRLPEPFQWLIIILFGFLGWTVLFGISFLIYP